MKEEFKLTQYSHGAGCGCKISPAVLSTILHGGLTQHEDKALLVGYESSDDAAVYDLGDGSAIISTTDFFMPIVDDPFTFGRIAATNAISDVYAMGGKPLFAIAVLGWPINVLPPEVAKNVIDGGRQACKDAGIVLAGGHSIDSPEPIFGLAVTGRVSIEHLKKNNTAQEGSILYLTKPIGIGILTTAQKKGLLKPEHEYIAANLMTRLNIVGEELAQIPGVVSMTDVTGFGLLGHLSEMCEGSKLSAVIHFEEVPIIPEANEYIEQGCIPGGTGRNWDSYGHHIALKSSDQKNILCDPQTSGGLLIAVKPAYSHQVEELLQRHSLYSRPIGSIIEKTSHTIIIA